MGGPPNEVDPRGLKCVRRGGGDSSVPDGSVDPRVPNGFEAGNELPPSLTAAGVTSEGTDPALESDSLAAGVTKPEGAAPASEGDSRVRGQAEPGGAAYVAVENMDCGLYPQGGSSFGRKSYT